MPSRIPARGVVYDLITDEEKIFAGTLCYVSIGAQHDRLVESGTLRLGLGQNRAHIISRDLGLGHHDVRMQPRERCNIGTDAALLGFGAQKSLPLPDRDHETRFSGLDSQTHRAVKVDHRADVAR